MQPELQHRFDAIERQRTDLESRARAFSETQLNWKPAADTWSIGQIVQHLVLGDETVGRAQEPGAVETEATMFRVLPRAWRRALVLRALKRDTVLPLPSPDIEPHGDVPLPELLKRWEAARAEMRRVLETLQGDEPRYSHPVLGPLTAVQMLELGETHTAYHTRQMETLRNKECFPSASAAMVVLREVNDDDLPIFFEHQRDPEANHMAAFTAKDPADWEDFLAHWAKIRADDTIKNRTVLLGGRVIGHVAKFEAFGEPEVSYWIGREFWGRGLATQALSEFLRVVKTRPLYARAAKDNLASRRVLEKCGFTACGTDRGFANARGEVIEEIILRLEAVP